VVKVEGYKNTVFAAVTIDSEKKQLKKLNFGYSDRAMVYLNGRLIYGGNNSFRSRDYRFVGSLGYFDALYLPLEKGKNELRLAVSETFGGWGIKCCFEDMASISLTGSL